MVGKSTDELRNLIKCRKRKLPNAKVSEIAHTLGQDDRVTPNWLILTEKSKLPKPAKEAYPKPPKAPGKIILPISRSYRTVHDNEVPQSCYQMDLLFMKKFPSAMLYFQAFLRLC